MKFSFIYVVVDTVAQNIVQSFFAVSDAEAKRKISYSLEKDQIPSVMACDLKVFKCNQPVNFPETFDDTKSLDQLDFDFSKEVEK